MAADTDVRWSEDPCNTGTSSLTVGHFDGTSVVPYETDEPVETFHGPQGSWHILPDLHALGVPKAVELRWSVTDPVSGVDLSADVPGSRVWLIGSDPSNWQCEGGYDDLRLIFDPRVLQVADGDVGWQRVCNRPLSLELSVWSADGVLVVQRSVDFIPLPYAPDIEVDGPCPRQIGE